MKGRHYQGGQGATSHQSDCRGLLHFFSIHLWD
jgi:hypothetical protein